MTDDDKDYMLEKIRDDVENENEDEDDDYYFNIARDMAYRQSDFI